MITVQRVHRLFGSFVFLSLIGYAIPCNALAQMEFPSGCTLKTGASGVIDGKKCVRVVSDGGEMYLLETCGGYRCKTAIKPKSTKVKCDISAPSNPTFESLVENRGIRLQQLVTKIKQISDQVEVMGVSKNASEQKGFVYVDSSVLLNGKEDGAILSRVSQNAKSEKLNFFAVPAICGEEKCYRVFSSSTLLEANFLQIYTESLDDCPS